MGNTINKKTKIDYKFIEITDSILKQKYTQMILDKLPLWFGIPESTKEYIANVVQYPFWAALENDRCGGFISGRVHYNRTGDIYVFGVDPEFQGVGIGKGLIIKIEEYFQELNCEYIIVKTLSDIANYEPFEKTRKFYKAMGFNELITLTEMWDNENPCLIMIKKLNLK